MGGGVIHIFKFKRLICVDNFGINEQHYTMPISETQLADKFESERYDCARFKEEWTMLDIFNTYGQSRDVYRRANAYRANCLWCGERYSMAITVETAHLKESNLFRGGICKCFKCGKFSDLIGVAQKLSGKSITEILRDGKKKAIIKYYAK